MNEFPGFDPFADFGAYREALRQFFEGGWIMPRDLMPSAVASVVIPVDILDAGPELIIQANLPGVKSDDLSITVTGGVLTIKGSIQKTDEFKGSTFLRRERRASSYIRSINLPFPVDADRAEAKFQNGILTLALPKSEAVRPKVIKVASE